MVLPEAQSVQRDASHPDPLTPGPQLPAGNPADVPALLLMAEYNGTLAAARCVARHGIPVTVATNSLLAHTRWSRSVSRVERCPGFRDGPAAVADWLLGYGRRFEAAVLYPTCDEMAWVVSQYREELARHFYIYSPARHALRSILDKRELYAAAAAVGINTPRTWHPKDESDLASIIQQAAAVIVKPRSQTFFLSQKKGVLAKTLAQLRLAWREYRTSQYSPEVVADMGDVGFPMVQEYLPLAQERVESISGFVDRSGVMLDARASRKVLQMPPSAGVGLCFESIAPDSRLVSLIAALCRSIGYYGVFEAEFVYQDGRQLLIDFNPRYFGQMEFDIARGMELPWLVQLHATGHDAAARGSGARVAVSEPKMTYFADSRALRWYLTTGVALGAVSLQQRRQWLEWLKASPRSLADSILSSTDAGPSIASAAGRIWHALRHPFGFWRSVRGFKDRSGPCT